MRVLIERGADIKARDQQGNSPLIVAAGNGWVDVVRVLVEKGADITAKNNAGSTPLLIASANGKSQVVEYLAKASSGQK